MCRGDSADDDVKSLQQRLAPVGTGAGAPACIGLEALADCVTYISIDDELVRVRCMLDSCLSAAVWLQAGAPSRDRLCNAMCSQNGSSLLGGAD